MIKFPYNDTLGAIEYLSIDYPYASNLLCAVILERCLRNFAFENYYIKKKRVRLGKIVSSLKKCLPKNHASNLNKIKKLRDHYMHSDEHTKSDHLDDSIRVNQYKEDNIEFRKLLDWVQEKQYF